jgi:aspartate aminotransferase
VQKAAVAALTGSQQCVEEMRTDYISLRDQVLAKLREIPSVRCTVPEGAFYVYPNISAFMGKGKVSSAAELSTRLLHEAHVVTVPGEAFGTNEHIRLSYAVSHVDVAEGLQRMKAFFAKLG